MKNVLITGAAGGIGRAMCTAFSRAGYRVIGMDRAATVCSLDCEPMQFDLARLSEPGVADALGSELAYRLSGELDVLVNNAAVQHVGPIERLTLGQWRESLDVNLLAPFWLVQTLAPLLYAAKGSVINIASIHSQVTKAGFTAYSTTKGALVSLTRALAIEMAPDVRVNAILPAATDTPMLRRGFAGNESALDGLGACHPMGRIGRPDEVAALAVFLSASNCRFLTGEAIRVDGGIGALLHDPMSIAPRHHPDLDTADPAIQSPIEPPVLMSAGGDLALDAVRH